MDKATQSLIYIIRNRVFGKEFPEGFDFGKFSREEKAAVFDVASRHDLAHFVSDEKYYEAIWRVNAQESVLAEVEKLLSASYIPFCVLKGPVVRKLYPEPWMRTSADNDIFVGDAADRAVGILLANGFDSRIEGSHHINVKHTDTGMHVELHSVLVEDWKLPKAAEVLAGYDGSNAYIYFYHLAHMAKHVTAGGCGLRSFIDLALMVLNGYKDAEAEELIRRGGWKHLPWSARVMAYKL